jgi:putative flippase GtrA
VRWISTGAGPEGNIRLFLPRVLIEFALVLLLSAVSAGTVGLLLGAILLAYMNGYVGWVAANADPRVGPLAAALIAWPPWSAARVASFICAGTAAAIWGHPRLFARSRTNVPRASVRRLLLLAVGLLLLDIFLKWWLAPLWREWLRTLLGASAGIEAGGSA